MVWYANVLCCVVLCKLRAAFTITLHAHEPGYQVALKLFKLRCLHDLQFEPSKV